MKKYVVVHIHEYGMTLHYFRTATPIPEEALNTEETRDKVVKQLNINYDGEETESIIIEELGKLTRLQVVTL